MANIQTQTIKAATLSKGDLLVEDGELLIVGKIDSDGETLTVTTDDGWRLFNVEEFITITQ